MANDRLKVLSAAVDDFFNPRISQKVPEWTQITGGQRIDQCDAIGRRNLDHAQLRIVAVFTDKLAVIAKSAGLAQVCDQMSQLVWLGHNYWIVAGNKWVI